MVKLDFAKGVSVVLTGATNWARLTEATGPDSLSEKYQVDLTLDAESVKTLESMKILEHMQPKDRAGILKYEASTVRLKTNNAPTIWDTSKNVFKGNIGNGSTLRAKVLIKAYEMAGKKGLTAYINQGVVLSLVDFQESADDSLWEGIDVSPIAIEEAANVPSSKPDVATSAEAFGDTSNDDLPF